MEQNSGARYQVLIFVAALLFSTGGVAIKGSSLTSWQISAFRSAVAAAVLLVFVREARRGWTRASVAVACFYAATLVTFVAATKLGTAANAIFLQSCAPLYMLALSPMVLKEKIRRQDVVVFACIACGMALLLHDGFGGNLNANLVGVLSGIAWACTLAGLRWLGKRDRRGSPQATVAMGNVIACLVCLPFALPVAAMPVLDVALILYLGIFQIALAYICLTASIRHVPAVQASTLLLIEPVFNPAWTWLLHGENPGGYALAGGGLIVLSSIYSIAATRGSGA